MTIEQILYCTMYIIVRTGIRSNSLKKSRALLYSDLVRQTNRHASSEPSCVKRTVRRQPSCVKRTVIRQPSEYEINYSFIIPTFWAVMRQPSCVKVWIGLKYDIYKKLYIYIYIQIIYLRIWSLGRKGKCFYEYISLFQFTLVAIH